MQFKKGDMIKFIGELDEKGTSKNGGYDFVDEMKVLLDRKPRKIKEIKYFTDSKFSALIEGVKSPNGVRWSYSSVDFEKVEVYEIGKKYIVSYDEKFLENENYCNDQGNQRILVAYIPNAKPPFICVSVGYETEYWNGEEFMTSGWKYIQKVPEYKPYYEFHSSWKGESIKAKNFNIELEIIGTYYDYKNRKTKICAKNNNDEIFIFSNEEMFENYTWLDGSVCGELKEGKNEI